MSVILFEEHWGSALLGTSQYPKRRFVVLEDALAANGLHLKALRRHGMDFIIVAKPQGNAGLFEAVGERLRQGLCTEWEEADPDNNLTRGTALPIKWR